MLKYSGSRSFYREFDTCQEKIFGRVVLGLYVNTHKNFVKAFLARCVLKSNETGRNYILVRLWLTMCANPKVELILYDTVTKQCDLHPAQSEFREYWSNPNAQYNFEESEMAYVHFITSTNLMYDASRMILRCCKKPMKSCHDFRDEELFGENGDRDDAIWEAEDDEVFNIDSNACRADESRGSRRFNNGEKKTYHSLDPSGDEALPVTPKANNKRRQMQKKKLLMSSVTPATDKKLRGRPKVTIDAEDTSNTNMYVNEEVS